MKNDNLKAPKLFFDDADFACEFSLDTPLPFQRSEPHSQRFGEISQNLQTNENSQKLKKTRENKR